MEASSPLAAMQPASFGMPSWGHTSHPHSHFAAPNSFGPDAFNFRDISMKRLSSDYFAVQPVRGSSPTASLAADLSQNFHIDMR
jgi:M-phase inducer tyrosine phosphatase